MRRAILRQPCGLRCGSATCWCRPPGSGADGRDWVALGSCSTKPGWRRSGGVRGRTVGGDTVRRHRRESGREPGPGGHDRIPALDVSDRAADSGRGPGPCARTPRTCCLPEARGGSGRLRFALPSAHHGGASFVSCSLRAPSLALLAAAAGVPMAWWRSAWRGTRCGADSHRWNCPRSTF